MYERVYPLGSLSSLGRLIGLQLVPEPVMPAELLTYEEAKAQAEAQVEVADMDDLLKQLDLTQELRYGKDYCQALSEWRNLARIYPAGWNKKRTYPGTISSWSRETSPKPADNGVEYVVVGWDERIADPKETINDVLRDVMHALGCGCEGCASRMKTLIARHQAPVTA